MVQLIVFRAVQGIGGGALFTTPPSPSSATSSRRASGAGWRGMFGAIFGLSSTVGRLVGGYFTDHGTMTLMGHWSPDWRWVFYPEPAAQPAVAVHDHRQDAEDEPSGEGGKIDFIRRGPDHRHVVPLAAGADLRRPPVRLALGAELSLFAGSAIGLALYVLRERFASDPILPLDPLQKPPPSRRPTWPASWSR